MLSCAARTYRRKQVTEPFQTLHRTPEKKPLFALSRLYEQRPGGLGGVADPDAALPLLDGRVHAADGRAGDGGRRRGDGAQDDGARRDAAAAAAEEHHGQRTCAHQGDRQVQVHLHPEHHPGAPQNPESLNVT